MGCSSSQNVKGRQIAWPSPLAGSTTGIAAVYDIDKRKPLGEGAEGTVCKATHKATGSTYAVKTIPHASLTVKHKEEIDILKSLKHPNIIRLHENFADRRNTYIVMDLCSGGELYDKLMNDGSIAEQQSAVLMYQMLDALRYMHEQRICHRDLKPENIMLATSAALDTTVVKIIDFGLAKRFNAGETMSTMVGSAYYVAPQVLNGKYNQLCDMWSCGVIMHCMLGAEPPFTGETDEEVFQKVRLGKVTFEAPVWNSVSKSARDLIRSLIRMNPNERYTAEQALDHVWSKEAKAQVRALNLSCDEPAEPPMPTTLLQNCSKMGKPTKADKAERNNDLRDCGRGTVSMKLECSSIHLEFQAVAY